MTGRVGEPDRLVLYGDLEGRILAVTRDNLDTHMQAYVGRPFALAVDPGSFGTALSFLAALQARGAVLDWVIEVPAADGAIPLHFAGARAGERLLILGARSVSALRQLSAEEARCDSNALSAWQAIATCTDAALPSNGPDEALLNEYTRLNNELARLQRETAKQAAQLRALHQHARDYADELEARVEERTIELGASEARFSTMLETSGMGVAVVDQDGRISQANRALAELLGASRDSLRGATLADMFYDPDGGSALETQYGELMAGERDHFRLEGYCTHRDGELAWVNMTVTALRSTGPTPGAAIAMVEDITDKRQAQAALMHAERLALAGKLAASLAHEINNPLQSIIGCVGLAEEAAGAGESPADYLALARSELRRVASMVNRMRDLHRSPRTEPLRPIQINSLLEQVLALSRPQCEQQNVRVRRRLDTAALPIMASADELRQVFVNMVLNAIEAMPQGGSLLVRSESTGDPPGVRVSFADDGIGIAPDVLPHIFKAFYSTKPTGTGIGLAITQDIVRRYGGHIQVESEVSAGSRFSIWFPASGQDEETTTGTTEGRQDV